MEARDQKGGKTHDDERKKGMQAVNQCRVKYHIMKGGWIVG